MATARVVTQASRLLLERQVFMLKEVPYGHGLLFWQRVPIAIAQPFGQLRHQIFVFGRIDYVDRHEGAFAVVVELPGHQHIGVRFTPFGIAIIS
jgi:hypothetical protein